MRTSLLLRTAAALLVALPLAATAADAAPAPAPACSTPWGSLPKVDAGMSTAVLTGLRTGRHACFDRLVVDVAGDVDGWDVRYVSAVTQQGTGDPISLRGGAAIEIVVHSHAERRLSASVAGFSTFREVGWGGSFEGYTTIGLGVRARLPMRVFVLDGPGDGSRLVIDVAHRW